MPILALLLVALFQAPPGRYTSRGINLEIAEGRYRFSRAGRLIIGGAIEVEASGIVMRDDSGAAPCSNAGHYRTRASGDSLFFSALDDACEGRRNAVAGAPWLRIREALALVHATLFDGTGTPPRPGMTLVMREGRIAAVFPDGAQPIPEDAATRDVAGQFVMPGLVDAHVHNATDPSGNDRRERAERRLRTAVRGGVVAVRDMAGDARALADLSRAAMTGDILAPEIHYSSLMAGPDFFTDPRVRATSAGFAPGEAIWAHAVTAQTNLAELVTLARGTGATGIKLYAALDARTTAAIVREAHRQGVPVWAHLVLAPARPSDVVASGADVVSHAIYAAWETAPAMSWTRRASMDLSATPDNPAIRRVFEDMARRHTILDATLFVFRTDSTVPDTAFAARRFARAIEFVRAAHDLGVRMDAGTDGMVSDADTTALPNIHAELELLVRAGLSPSEALVAGTRTSAEAGGFADHGTIEVGKAADVLVLRQDPTADIRNTRSIAFVVRRGKVVQ